MRRTIRKDKKNKNFKKRGVRTMKGRTMKGRTMKGRTMKVIRKTNRKTLRRTNRKTLRNKSRQIRTQNNKRSKRRVYRKDRKDRKDRKRIRNRTRNKRRQNNRVETRGGGPLFGKAPDEITGEGVYNVLKHLGLDIGAGSKGEAATEANNPITWMTLFEGGASVPRWMQDRTIGRPGGSVDTMLELQGQIQQNWGDASWLTKKKGRSWKQIFIDLKINMLPVMTEYILRYCPFKIIGGFVDGRHWENTHGVRHLYDLPGKEKGHPESALSRHILFVGSDGSQRARALAKAGAAGQRCGERPDMKDAQPPHCPKTAANTDTVAPDPKNSWPICAICGIRRCDSCSTPWNPNEDVQSVLCNGNKRDGCMIERNMVLTKARTIYDPMEEEFVSDHADIHNLPDWTPVLGRSFRRSRQAMRKALRRCTESIVKGIAVEVMGGAAVDSNGWPVIGSRFGPEPDLKKYFIELLLDYFFQKTNFYTSWTDVLNLLGLRDKSSEKDLECVFARIREITQAATITHPDHTPSSTAERGRTPPHPPSSPPGVVSVVSEEPAEELEVIDLAGVPDIIDLKGIDATCERMKEVGFEELGKVWDKALEAQNYVEIGDMAEYIQENQEDFMDNVVDATNLWQLFSKWIQERRVKKEKKYEQRRDRKSITQLIQINWVGGNQVMKIDTSVKLNDSTQQIHIIDNNGGNVAIVSREIWDRGVTYAEEGKYDIYLVYDAKLGLSELLPYKHLSEGHQKVFNDSPARELPKTSHDTSVISLDESVDVGLMPEPTPVPGGKVDIYLFLAHLHDEDDMIEAAEDGNMPELIRLLGEGWNVDVNAPDYLGRTAMYTAAMNNHVECMKVLVKHNADIDKAKTRIASEPPESLGSGLTPLIIATYKGHTDALKWLLEAGADWRQKDLLYGKTALDWAKEGGKTEEEAVLEKWIKEHPDESLIESEQAIEFDPYSEMESQINATTRRWVSQLSDAPGIESSPEPSPEPEPVPEPTTVAVPAESAFDRHTQLNKELIVAAKAGNASEMRQLLSQGANPNADEDGLTVLFWATTNNHVECMEALGEALGEDRVPMVDLNKIHYDKMTPLMFAVIFGKTEALHWLLDNGADWLLTNSNGNTALDLAKQQGPGREGRTEARDVLEAWIAAEPLMRAARNGQVDVVKSILESDPGIPQDPVTFALEKTGSRALYLAAEGNHVACMEELKKAGASVNYEASVNYKGKQEIHTPLMRAAYFGHCGAIKWLMEWYEQEAGTNDLGVPNDALKKAMDIAVAEGKPKAKAELNAWTTLQRRKRRLFREHDDSIEIKFVNNASFDIYIYKQDVKAGPRRSNAHILTLKRSPPSQLWIQWQFLPKNRDDDCFYIAVPANSLNSTEAFNSDKALFVSAANVRKYGFEYGGGELGDGPSQCMNERDLYFDSVEYALTHHPVDPSFQLAPVSGGL